MLRSYRVILEVDIEIEFEDGEDPDWNEVESDLENRDDWDVYCEAFASSPASVNYAEVDSYDVEWESE